MGRVGLWRVWSSAMGLGYWRFGPGITKIALSISTNSTSTRGCRNWAAIVTIVKPLRGNLQGYKKSKNKAAPQFQTGSATASILHTSMPQMKGTKKWPEQLAVHGHELPIDHCEALINAFCPSFMCVSSVVTLAEKASLWPDHSPEIYNWEC